MIFSRESGLSSIEIQDGREKPRCDAVGRTAEAQRKRREGGNRKGGGAVYAISSEWCRGPGGKGQS
jgi:hypothetical protein